MPPSPKKPGVGDRPPPHHPLQLWPVPAPPSNQLICAHLGCYTWGTSHPHTLKAHPPHQTQLTVQHPSRLALSGHVPRARRSWWCITHRVSLWGASHGNPGAPEERGTQIQRSHSTEVSAFLRHRDSSELSILWQMLTFWGFFPNSESFAEILYS